MKKLTTLTICLALLLSAAWPPAVRACPFCSAVSQTLSQEIDGSDVAVIARLVKLPPEADLNSGESTTLDLDDPDTGMAQFEVLETIHGDNSPAKGTLIKVVYFGGNEQKKRFLISGLAGETIDWTTPLPLTDRGVDYIKSLGSLPEKGPERLVFFMEHLEDADPLLAQDAYDEFGRAPYEVVVGVGDQMDRQRLISWIEDSGVGPTRRRLYLTMLGICGQAEDIDILESLLLYDYQQMKPGLATNLAMMASSGPSFGSPILNEMVKSDVRRKQQCLDALIAAYLKLKGPEGLPLIEERFLTNPAAEYTHVYATVMALRFHGEETDAIPQSRLLESVRLLLDNAEIADQVIPDLARWEDWTVMDRLVTMFKTSEADAWIRQPVISYLLAASDQPAEISDQANAALAELEELDPKAVKRARSYMAFGLLARAGSKKKKSSEPSDDKPAVAADKEATDLLADKPVADPTKNDLSQKVTSQKAAPQTDASVAAAADSSPPGLSRKTIIGVPIIAGLLLMGIFALLLRGADVRSSNPDS